MKFTLLHEAEIEMVDAARYYEAEQPGLGLRFLDAVYRAFSDVRDYPLRWPITGKGARRRLVGRFAYGVVYKVDVDEIVIVAVANLHRRPHYWSKRIS